LEPQISPISPIENPGNRVGRLYHQAVVLEAFRPEVQEQRSPMTGRSQVVDHLGVVDGEEAFCRFELHQDRLVAEKVDSVVNW
jgi:hypothetical protein